MESTRCRVRGVIGTHRNSNFGKILVRSEDFTHPTSLCDFDEFVALDQRTPVSFLTARPLPTRAAMARHPALHLESLVAQRLDRSKFGYGTSIAMPPPINPKKGATKMIRNIGPSAGLPQATASGGRDAM